MFTWTTLHLVAEWIIRLVMLVYVPQRRSPAAARIGELGRSRLHGVTGRRHTGSRTG